MVQMFKSTQFWIWLKDPWESEEAVHEIRIKGDPGISGYIFEEGTDIQLMVKLLKEEISDVPVRAGRYKVIADFKFFIKINSHLHRLHEEILQSLQSVWRKKQ